MTVPSISRFSARSSARASSFSGWGGEASFVYPVRGEPQLLMLGALPPQNAKLLCLSWWVGRGGKFCISEELKIYQGSKGEWIGSFAGQDIGNLPHLPTQLRFRVSRDKICQTSPPAPPSSNSGFPPAQHRELAPLPPPIHDSGLTPGSEVVPALGVWDRLGAHLIFRWQYPSGRARLRLHRPLSYRPPVVDCFWVGWWEKV